MDNLRIQNILPKSKELEEVGFDNDSGLVTH